MRTIHQLLISFLLHFFVANAVAQNITATIGSVTACGVNVGDTVVVPVYLTMGSGITFSAFSLTIDYDSSKLECIGLFNSAIPGVSSNCGRFNNLSPNPPFNTSMRRQFKASYFSGTPMIVNGLFFNLRFRVLANGFSPLNWDTFTNGNCEFVDDFLEIISDVSWVMGDLIQPDIQASLSTNGFCPGGGLRLNLLSNSFSGFPFRWKHNGNLLAGANSDTLFVTQAGDYQMEIEVSPTCTLVSNTLSITVLNCNRITGDLRYDNSNQMPLAGVPIHLKTLLGNIVASDTTDSAGVYDMSGYVNGNYVLDANVNYSWGGVNSLDALQVTRLFSSLITLSPLRVKAGDVNGNNITNSADALLINRRITGLLSAFSVGDFVNSLPSVNAAGNPLQGNLRVLSTGDVNGTYNPLPLAPALVLDTVYGIGNVGTAVVRFTTAGSGVFERGIVWSSSPNPTLTSNKSIAGTGGFGFTHSFSSIDPNNIQYARAYARTSAGVYYSPERNFIPGLRCPGTPSVTDIDGNVYNTVQIGTQCWTQSNLKVTKYRNGDNIPTGLSNATWYNTTSGAYAIYNNDPVNDGLYGKLYNHYAVMDSRGLCPTGWHVPSDEEWNVLVKYLDPNADTVCVNCWQSSTAGGALKSTAMQPTPGGWNLPNTGATNSSGFTALPGGFRDYVGDFDDLSSDGYWWSSSVSSASNAWFRYLYVTSVIWRSNGYNRSFGYSVRCCRD